MLPGLPFTLSAPASGLLLVFRTNASYARWNEARQAWGRIVSHCRNIMRQSTLWIDTDDPTAQAALEELRQCVYAFPRSLWAHLSAPEKEPRFEQDIRAAMGDAAASHLLAAPHLAAARILDAEHGDGQPSPSIDEKKKVEMDKSCILLGDACETCERIFSSPDAARLHAPHRPLPLGVAAAAAARAVRRVWEQFGPRAPRAAADDHAVQHLPLRHRGARGAARGAILHPAARGPLQ